MRMPVIGRELRDIGARDGVIDGVRTTAALRLVIEARILPANRVRSFFDALMLQLRRGENDVVFVVSEGGGGWAAAASFPDLDGVTLVSP